MIVLIDNYDSFTFNLAQLLETTTEERIEIVRNDACEPRQLLELEPKAIVISPGPGTPSRAGRIVETIRAAGSTPILGICLGHQAIVEAFGGRIVRGKEPVHGKVDAIDHHGRGLFEGCAAPFAATRYHSLVAERDTLPGELMIDAVGSDGAIMAVSHRSRPVYGLQFHPESYGTSGGAQLVRNFLALGGLA
jgi:anthranilate synthase/aminodeoxychorismate synthase-like glutamine amidotransferase